MTMEHRGKWTELREEESHCRDEVFCGLCGATVAGWERLRYLRVLRFGFTLPSSETPEHQGVWIRG